MFLDTKSENRVYKYNNPLPREFAKGANKQKDYGNSYKEQILILKVKNCSYRL